MNARLPPFVLLFALSAIGAGGFQPPPGLIAGLPVARNHINHNSFLDAHVFMSAFVRPEGPPGQIVERLLRDAAFEVVLGPGVTTSGGR